MALQILQWNCRSIQNKIPELLSYLANLVNLPDVLCLQETYLTKNTTPILPGYKFIRKDRSNGKRGGGICIYIKPSTPFSEVIIPNSQNDMESMAIKVSGIVILNVYNPPSNLVDNNILQFITNFRNVIICGDFHKFRPKLLADRLNTMFSRNSPQMCCRSYR